MPHPHQPAYRYQSPILIHDRRPFYRGFLLGSLVAMMIYGGLRVTVWHQPNSAAMLAESASLDDQQAILAIARAEQINLAASAYLESCGADLASQAWTEAASEQERYELLSAFIAFSPTEFTEYMPEAYEIVLWDKIGAEAQDTKAALLVAGMVLEY